MPVIRTRAVPGQPGIGRHPASAAIPAPCSARVAQDCGRGPARPAGRMLTVHRPGRAGPVPGDEVTGECHIQPVPAAGSAVQDRHQHIACARTVS